MLISASSSELPGLYELCPFGHKTLMSAEMLTVLMSALEKSGMSERELTTLSGVWHCDLGMGATLCDTWSFPAEPRNVLCRSI